ncbi:MAG: hypothetical protein ACKVQQ_21180 [Burkholderiales bacterium]
MAPEMTVEQIRSLKARLDFVSRRMEAEEADTPVDPVRNREIAEALAVSAWQRGWRPAHDSERAAEKMRVLRLLHGSGLHSAA